MVAQRRPELHDQLHGEHRRGVRHRVGQSRTLELGGGSARRVHPHRRQRTRHRAELLQSVPQRQRLLCAGQGRVLFADRAVCTHDRAAAVLDPQSAAVPDFRLHLSDRKSEARPGLQARREPDAGAETQIHADGRHRRPDRRNTTDDASRRRRPEAAVHSVGQLRHDEELLRLGQCALPVRQMVDHEPQRHLHPSGPARRSAYARSALQLLFRERFDHLHAPREVLHRPVIPPSGPHGLRQLLGGADALPQCGDQKTVRRQVHRRMLGAQPDRPTAACRRTRRRVRPQG